MCTNICVQTYLYKQECRVRFHHEGKNRGYQKDEQCVQLENCGIDAYAAGAELSQNIRIGAWVRLSGAVNTLVRGTGAVDKNEIGIVNLLN
jgi:hypothetical protein